MEVKKAVNFPRRSFFQNSMCKWRNFLKTCSFLQYVVCGKKLGHSFLKTSLVSGGMNRFDVMWEGRLLERGGGGYVTRISRLVHFLLSGYTFLPPFTNFQCIEIIAYLDCFHHSDMKFPSLLFLPFFNFNFVNFLGNGKVE